MNERIKEIRKALSLTQNDFAEKIGVRQATVASYESGRRDPVDAIILSICRVFRVNETWLRTGEGEMFIQTSRDDDIAAFVATAMRGTGDNFQRRMLSVLSRLSADEWEWLEDKAREILGETENGAQD